MYLYVSIYNTAVCNEIDCYKISINHCLTAGLHMKFFGIYVPSQTFWTFFNFFRNNINKHIVLSLDKLKTHTRTRQD